MYLKSQASCVLLQRGASDHVEQLQNELHETQRKLEKFQKMVINSSLNRTTFDTVEVHHFTCLNLL